MPFQPRPEQPVHISAPQLRGLLEQALLTDADFDAFCIDYAPDIYRRFSAGMERTQKMNLLLSGTAAPDLLAALKHRASGIAAGKLTKPSPKQLRPTQRLPRRIAMALVAVVLLALLVGRFFLRTHPTRSTEPDDRAAVSPTPPRLTSEPAEGLVYAVPSGQLLGSTPWAPDASYVGTAVCVRSPGFVPALVKLEPRPEPSWFRPVHVRLQPQPRAGPLRDLKQETCHVPTPLLE